MKAKDAIEILNVSHRTLENYVKAGKLHPVKLNCRHFDYDPEEIYAMVGRGRARVNVTYSRVSLPKQKGDLAAQTARLRDFAAAAGYTIDEQIEDVRSGMDFTNRRGFRRLVDRVLKHEIRTVIVENRDRLARFGFDLVREVFAKCGTTVVVMSEQDNRSYEQELTDDLVSIIHHYSMKSYSHRRRLHNAERALKETKPDYEPQE